MVKPIDAIITPTARPTGATDFAVTLSDTLRTHLIILRDLTITQARNQGLRIARTMGWEHIMFLDDDLRLHPEQVTGNMKTLDSVQVVAFTAKDFPDNSVVRHAARKAGIPTVVFPSGGAMMVNMKQVPETRWFPDIYNEDWFFMHGLDVANGGDVEQLPYDPFTLGRASREELGDLTAEAIQGKPVIMDDEFWVNAIKERRGFLTGINVSGAAEVSVREARNRLNEITTGDVQGVLRDWQGKCVLH